MIKYTNIAEIFFVYDDTIISFIKKCGALFCKYNKKWYIQSNNVEILEKTLSQVGLEVVIDDHDYAKKKVCFDDKEKCFILTEKGSDAALARKFAGLDEVDKNHDKSLEVIVKGEELRVKLDIPKSIYAGFMKMGCTRDYKNHQIVFKNPDYFYNYCSENYVDFKIIG